MASLEEIRNSRIAKLTALKEKGINAYPAKTNRELSLSDVNSQFSKLSKKKRGITVAGRVTAMRGQGSLVFVDLYDGTDNFQGLFKKDEIKKEDFDILKNYVDVGDFVEITGILFLTKRKEKTILTKKWGMLSKSLRPLPEKWHGLQDIEERYRRRYLDLVSSKEVKSRFLIRSAFVRELRNYLDKDGFIEVETPILQPLAGGANAKPFTTHHNALDIDLNLRIAPELYLKELIIGGFTKIFEIGRLFRNEGIDTTHNPEFTTIELYEAYKDAETHMLFLEKLLKSIIKKVTGDMSINYDGNKILFSKKFQRISYFELLKRHAHITNIEKASRDEIVLSAKQLGVNIEKSDTREKIMDNIYKKTCKPRLIQPTYIVDYPIGATPLAKRKDGALNIIDRYQLVAGGIEIVNAFSELNDPIEQRVRFLEQEKNKQAGDDEAQPKDEEFIEAMEYGMPPTAGLAISIDRMSMLLTDTKNIREVILFPTLRPK